MNVKALGLFLGLVGSSCLVACGEPPVVGDAAVPQDGAAPDGGGEADAAVSPLPDTLGPADRPAALVVPPAHDGVTPRPLLVALHGYTGDATQLSLFLGLERTASREGFYLILPDGTRDASGARFWNATDDCCDFLGTGVDDVAYLESLIDELSGLAPVDPTRIYFLGHSNGGFMSYRMACELSDRVAAIVSLAGSDYGSPDACVPSEAVSVLQVHGDADTTVAYQGGSVGAGSFPSAPDVAARWAGRAGCDLMADPAESGPFDLLTSVSGPETTTRTWSVGCAPGHEVQLWTMAGGGHVPAVQPEFTPRVFEWLLAQHR